MFVRLLFLFILSVLYTACKGQGKLDQSVNPTHNTKPIPQILGTPPLANPTHNPYKDTGLVSQYIRSIFQDSKGNYWFGPAGESVVKYDTKTLNYISKEEFFRGNDRVKMDWVSIHAIAEDKQGNIWFGTEHGVVKYDGSTFNSYTDKHGLDNINVGRRCILADKTGTIWVGTMAGVFKYNPAFDKKGAKCFSRFTLIPSVKISDIMQDQERNIWFATQDHGVYRYDGKSIKNITYKDGLSDNYAGGMIQDDQGQYWFTQKGGICRYDGKSFKEYTNKDGLGGTEIWGIYKERSGIIWVTARGSTTRFDPSIKDSTAFKVFKVEDGINCCVQSMYQDKSGRMWWGTGQGLYRFDGNRFYQVKQTGPW